MGQQDAFKSIVAIDQASKDNSVIINENDDARPRWGGIAFSIGEERFVAAIGEVVEMADISLISRMPWVASWVVGIGNIRGRLLPVVDLHAFISGRKSTMKGVYKVLIVDTGVTYVGLAVSAVFGMQYFYTDTFIEIGDTEELPVKKEYLKGFLTDVDGSQWKIFSPVALVESDEFTNIKI